MRGAQTRLQRVVGRNRSNEKVPMKHCVEEKTCFPPLKDNSFTLVVTKEKTLVSHLIFSLQGAPK